MKWLDDKLLQVEVQSLESRTHHTIKAELGLSRINIVT